MEVLMNKITKIIIALCIALQIVMLIPFRTWHLEGSDGYKALLYTIVIFKGSPVYDGEKNEKLYGWTVEIFGKEIFNNIKVVGEE